MTDTFTLVLHLTRRESYAKNNHNVTTILRLNPNSAYYRIKHSTTTLLQAHTLWRSLS
jgi:hypothetical protein